MPSKHFWLFSAYTFTSNYKKNKVSNTSSDYVLAKTLPFRFIQFHSFHVFVSRFAHLTRYTHSLIYSFHLLASPHGLPRSFHSLIRSFASRVRKCYATSSPVPLRSLHSAPSMRATGRSGISRM
jgi:protoheme ferro-lyase